MEQENKAATEGDKVIGKFMGMKWKPVRANWTKYTSCYQQILFDTQEDCLIFCNGLNVEKDPDHCFVPLPDVHGYILNYSSDWNLIMEAVDKIEKIGYTSNIEKMNYSFPQHRVWFNKIVTLEEVANGGREDDKLSAVYAAVVDFINWYNKQENEAEKQ